jgi:hypothetical protein
MVGFKAWYVSKGVMGPIVAIITMVAALFDLEIDATELLDALMMVLTGAGILVGIWGRITAEKKISLVTPDAVVPVGRKKKKKR